MFFVKIPFWIKLFYPSLVWNKDRAEKKIYLTFDDGPNDTATTYVLNELKRHNAFATFFCIGKNVESNADVYNRIINDGHTVGNHTQNHVNGWNVSCHEYFEDISKAKEKIDSTLFRPPYGRVKRSQIKALKKMGFEIIMWDVLSGDFDLNLSNEECLKNVLQNAQSGSIIVFHDSEKAFSKLKYTLPKVLEHLSNKGFVFSSI